MVDQKAIVAELDGLIADCTALRQRGKYPDYSDLPESETVAMLTSLASAIRRLAPPRSQYLESVDALLKRAGYDNCTILPAVLGIATALRGDVAAGRMQNAIELIHADLFSDFLDMVDHLLGEGFKDPAAVVAGSVLEGHLRQLAPKHGVSVVDGKGQNKKADLVNSELAAAGAYGKGDQKSITAWLHIRNSAAHGNYGDYTKDQVVLLAQAVRNFTSRIPA
jgi:hypothetical protein